MHNARIRSLSVLWWLVALPVLAQPLPPLTRSVLTTNIPAFGSSGQVLCRTTVLPYLDWSNLVWQLLGTNALTLKLDSNWWWTAYGSNTLVVGPGIGMTVSGTTNIIFTTNQPPLIYTNPTVSGNVIVSGTVTASNASSSNYVGGMLAIGTNVQPTVITPNGFVGVLTNNPQAPLYVRGTNGPHQGIFVVDASAMVANRTNAIWVGTNGNVGFRKTGGTSFCIDAGSSINTDGSYLELGNSVLGGTSGSWDLVIGPPGRSSNVFWFGQANTATYSMMIASNLANPCVSFVNGNSIAVPANQSLIKVGIGTNSPRATIQITGDNSVENISILGTTNRQHLARLDTNGNGFIGGAFNPTNGLIHQGAASSIANITIVTNSTQIWCLNGTNQLVTLPDVTKTPAYQIYRFSITNGNALVIFTNATGNQTIRDGTSYSFKQVGIGSPSFFHDGAAWWSAARTKVIFPNASWSTSTNIPMAVAGSNYITYDTLETSNGQGISLTNGYQIYIRDPGQYLLTYSLVTQVGHNNDTNRVWLQQSAQNTPRSRTDVKLTSTAEQVVMTVNYIVPVVTNLTWFALACRSTDTGAQFVTGAAADATQPAMPSAIVTVNKISDTSP